MDPLSRARLLGQRRLDSEASPEEVAELDAILRSSPGAADAFANLSRLDAGLRGWFAEEGASERERRVLSLIGKPRRPWLARLALAASVLALAAGLSWWLAGTRGHRVESGAVAIGGKSSATVPEGAAFVAQAATVLALADGSRLGLHAGTRGVLGRRSVDIEEGTADLVVVPTGDGFEVRTPVGRVRVLGTSFRVSLDEEETEMDGKTMVLAVAVLAGLVEVEYGGQVFRLGAGQQAAYGRQDRERPRFRMVRAEVAEAKDGKITVKQAERGKRGTTDVTYTLSATAKVVLDGKAGKLADIPKGAFVTVSIDDKGEAVAVDASGATKAFAFKSAGKDKVELEIRVREGRPGETASFASEGVKVTIDGKEAKLDELKAGDRVTAVLSVDGKRVLAITTGRGRGEGERRPERSARVGGAVKSVDAKANTVTLAAGRGREVKAYELAAGAKVTIDGKPAKLEDLKEGVAVVLFLDAEGMKATAAVASGVTKPFMFKSAGKGKVDLEGFAREGAPGEAASFATDDVKVTVNGREANLDALKAGDRVMAQLSVDGKRVLSITVGRGRGDGVRPARAARVGGAVKSVDAKAGTITLAARGETAERTVALAAGATVTIEGKPAKLEDLKEGVAVILVLDAEGKKATTVATAGRRRGDGGE